MPSTQTSRIDRRQRAARATSRGRVLVIRERADQYVWSEYSAGVNIDSGSSTAFPLDVMLRRDWQRIDLTRDDVVVSVTLA
jgi:hypothetical protein